MDSVGSKRSALKFSVTFVCNIYIFDAIFVSNFSPLREKYVNERKGINTYRRYALRKGKWTNVNHPVDYITINSKMDKRTYNVRSQRKLDYKVDIYI